MGFYKYLHFFDTKVNHDMKTFFLFLFLKGIGFGLIGIYISIFLYLNGFEIEKIILIYAFKELINALFTFSIGHKLMFVLKQRISFIIGIIFYIITFILVNNLDLTTNLFIWVISYALAEAFFFNTYHVYICDKADNKNEGKELGLISLISQAGRILTPLIGAIIISLIGFNKTFFIGILFLIFSLFPLILTSITPLKNKIYLGYSNIKTLYKTKKKSFHSVTSWALEMGAYPLWEILLFIIIGGGIKLLGLLFSISSFLSSISSYYAGKKVDSNSSTLKFGLKTSIFSRFVAFGIMPIFLIISELVSNIFDPLYRNPRMVDTYKDMNSNKKYNVSLVMAFQVIWRFINSLTLFLVYILVLFFNNYAILISIIVMLLGKLYLNIIYKN